MRGIRLPGPCRGLLPQRTPVSLAVGYGLAQPTGSHCPADGTPGIAGLTLGHRCPSAQAGLTLGRTYHISLQSAIPPLTVVLLGHGLKSSPRIGATTVESDVPRRARSGSPRPATLAQDGLGHHPDGAQGLLESLFGALELPHPQTPSKDSSPDPSSPRPRSSPSTASVDLASFLQAQTARMVATDFFAVDAIWRTPYYRPFVIELELRRSSCAALPPTPYLSG